MYLTKVKIFDSTTESEVNKWLESHLDISILSIRYAVGPYGGNNVCILYTEPHKEQEEPDIYPKFYRED